MLAALLTLLMGVCTAGAQTQEKKLVDRLLRPDTSMANPAQEKTFVAKRGVSFERRIPARSFYAREKTLTKPFAADQARPPQQIPARHFRRGDSKANFSTHSEFAKKERTISIPQVSGIRVAPESTTTVEVREFPGQRAFVARGKSQRALQAYNRPLTIEQVRELLNKSK